MSNLVGKSIGRYHIIEKLGEGGMATVYKAYDTHLEAEVAVKVIRVDMFPPAVLERVLKRFEREAKALARLNHPNIVSVLNYGEFDGAPYLVMKYLAGGTLKQRLGQPMPYEAAAQLLEPVARALSHAHRNGILHRDVKPSNILFAESGEPILADFGIAKLVESSEGQTLTGTGVGAGTPEYMAPEQGLGKEVDGRVDVYSLGVVFYELITGRKPYIADTPLAVLLKQFNDPLPRPRDFVPNLPDSVERVIFKALAKQPEARYADMVAFAIALDKLAREIRFRKPDQTVVTIKPKQFDPVAQTPIAAETRDELVGVSAHSLNAQKQTKNVKKRWWKWAAGGLIMLGLLVGLFAGVIAPGIERSQARAIASTAQANETMQAYLIMVDQTEQFGTSQAVEKAKTQEFIAGKTATAGSWTATPHDTQTPAITATPTLGIVSTRVREVDGMEIVYVPAGPFEMGSDEGRTGVVNIV